MGTSGLCSRRTHQSSRILHSGLGDGVRAMHWLGMSQVTRTALQWPAGEVR